MADPKYSGSDLRIEFSDRVLADMEADPELAEAVRAAAAIMRQAQQQVFDGKYETVEEALSAMGMHAMPVDLGGDGDDEEAGDAD
jgi:hypothetical protein